MVDLYDALDVPKDADAAAIRKAYRKAAKRAHPDGGGSREQFALVTLAHDTLSDAERRKRYDETGKAGEKQPDQTAAQALNLAIGAVNLVLDAMVQRGLSDIDVVADAVVTVKHNRKEKADEQRRLTVAANRIERMAKRFKAKHSKTNRISPMLISQAREQRKNAEAAQKLIDVMDAAIAILQDHEFEFDPVSQKAAYATFGNPFFTSAGA